MFVDHRRILGERIARALTRHLVGGQWDGIDSWHHGLHTVYSPADGGAAAEWNGMLTAHNRETGETTLFLMHARHSADKLLSSVDRITRDAEATLAAYEASAVQGAGKALPRKTAALTIELQGRLHRLYHHVRVCVGASDLTDADDVARLAKLGWLVFGPVSTCIELKSQNGLI